MRVHHSAKIAGCALLASVFAVSGMPIVAAQSLPQPQSEDAAPRLPDGFFVTPPRPVVPIPQFQFDYRSPSSGSSEATPDDQPLGGCRYEERKLELLV